MSTPYLEYLTPELMQHIAFFAADTPSPPSAVLAFALTCKTAASALLSSSYLFDRIFRLKFDLAAPLRRFGPQIAQSSVLAAELRRRCSALRRIRDCEVYGPWVRHDLWTVYLMALENDGRNEVQLVGYARVARFVGVFLSQRMYEGAEGDGGWPLETEENALAVWLLWLGMDAHDLDVEHPNERAAALAALQPFFVAAFKYAPTMIPETHFILPLDASRPEVNINPARSFPTIHGYYPIYRPVPSSPSSPSPSSSSSPYPHIFAPFNILLALTPPPLTPAAILAWFARDERRIWLHPGRANLPARRADLDDAPVGVGFHRRTMEDYEEFNTRVRTRCVPRVGGEREVATFFDDDSASLSLSQSHSEAIGGPAFGPVRGGREERERGSMQHEHDWLRTARCGNPWIDARIKVRVFNPGMLDGNWEGRFLTFFPLEYEQILGFKSKPLNLSASFPAYSTIPLFMTLREHHCVPPPVAPCPFAKNGFRTRDGDGGENGNGNGRGPTTVIHGGLGPGSGDGVSNAWFNPGVELVESEGKLHITDHMQLETTTYHTYDPARPNPHAEAGGCEACRPERRPRDWEMRVDPAVERIFESEGVGMRRRHRGGDGSESGEEDDGEGEEEDVMWNDCISDIVVTGETDPVHARAWGFMKVYGRVRDTDGLIVLARVPQEPTTIGVGCFLLRGYIHANQNFCGRWRYMDHNPLFTPTLEGSFTMCKRPPVNDS
ncbi:hypothetical protein BD410DRAFT_799926 [Rickenella mellea]|uniref:F-box domain-containing protein n=1 Tax=Rickenella mellea TaxID=50990 RepID=A0A4Y7QGM2_9AGAM|nr:hypothetical protein BD410DRAFT_799926 [Rickenella mellea]